RWPGVGAGLLADHGPRAARRARAAVGRVTRARPGAAARSARRRTGTLTQGPPARRRVTATAWRATGPVQLTQILVGVDVAAVRGDADVEITSGEHDSRAVRPGALFACIPGHSTDGHLYAPAAVQAGAVALLVERSVTTGAAE